MSHRPPHPHPDHVYHHFDHHLPNHHLLHHHHPHLSWASSLFKGNPLFPSQLRRLQDEPQPKFYFSSSFFFIFIILAILTAIDFFTILTPSILMLGLFGSIFHISSFPAERAVLSSCDGGDDSGLPEQDPGGGQPCHHPHRHHHHQHLKLILIIRSLLPPPSTPSRSSGCPHSRGLGSSHHQRGKFLKQKN